MAAAARGFLDQCLDLAEGVVGGAERLTGTTPALGAVPSSSTALRRTQYRIVEILEEDGRPAWIVTDGVENAVCTTKSLAERVARALG